jgi:hypothetical protein
VEFVLRNAAGLAFTHSPEFIEQSLWNRPHTFSGYVNLDLSPNRRRIPGFKGQHQIVGL